MDNSVKTALVIGASSEIGGALSQRLKRDGWRVFGTARHPGESDVRFSLVDPIPIKEFKRLLNGQGWDLLVIAAATLEPIGKFFDVPFASWKQSVCTNFTDHMRVLHELWPLRNKECLVDVMLFAGGGTNGPMTNYSAYCVAKIALIKMCELLHDENPDLNIFAIGPGYVKSKIHKQTLKAGLKKAGSGYEKTMELLQTEGTSLDDIYAHLRWCMKAGRDVAGGRNFSTVHDPWRTLSPEHFNSVDFENQYRLRRV